MAGEIKSTPNVVVDENFIMFAKALKRRYAERGEIFTDSVAMEQECKDARTRAIAPEAYRKMTAINVAEYRSENGSKCMTTEDYLRYFEECKDTFDAVNYYDLHKEIRVGEDKPRVLVNNKNIARAMRAKNCASAPARKREVPESAFASLFASVSQFKKRVAAGVAVAAVSLMCVAGGTALFADGSADISNANYVEEQHSRAVNLADANQMVVFSNNN